MNRILVIRGGAIGDFVLTLPAIKLLRDAWPHSHLEILGYKHISALAENRFYANATRSIESGALARFFAKDAELPRDVADYFGSFVLIVSYLFDADGVFERNVRRCGVEAFLAGPAKLSGNQHAALQLAQPLRELGLILDDPAARLYPLADDRDAARILSGAAHDPIVAIHPGSGSGSGTKNWLIGNWLELIQSLLASGDAGSLLVVGGEADEPQLATLNASLATSGVMFAENLALPTLAAALKQCALFIGHDSGISHIAAAVGARCVLLFGPTDPKVWAPRNAGVQIMQAANRRMSEIAAEDVIAAAGTVLSGRAATN